jgi:DNA-directed RNA polymerase II subunit RPB3
MGMPMGLPSGQGFMQRGQMPAMGGEQRFMHVREMPKIKVLEVDKYTIRFKLMNTDLTVANALRRIIISEVPTMAIELVEIFENTSALHDEFLAHRCGLIPLVSDDVDSYNFIQQCGCQYGNCEKCAVNFGLDVEFQSHGVYSVTAKDIVPANSECSVKPVKFIDTKTGEVQDAITIMKLGRAQKLNFRMIARKGIGK